MKTSSRTSTSKTGSTARRSIDNDGGGATGVVRKRISETQNRRSSITTNGDKTVDKSNPDSVAEFAANPFDKVRKAIKFKSVVSKWKRSTKTTDPTKTVEKSTENGGNNKEALSKKNSKSPESVKRAIENKAKLTTDDKFDKQNKRKGSNSPKKCIAREEELETDIEQLQIETGEVYAIGTALEKYLNVISSYKTEDNTGNKQNQDENTKRGSISQTSSAIRKALSPAGRRKGIQRSDSNTKRRAGISAGIELDQI